MRVPQLESSAIKEGVLKAKFSLSESPPLLGKVEETEAVHITILTIICKNRSF